MYRWPDDDFARSEDAAGAIGFALVWSLFFGAACVLVTPGVLRQVASARWPTATATITVSEYQAGKKRNWQLAYEYSVGGRSYTGTAYAADPMPIQGETEVQRHVAAYPVGAAVTASYDPANPANAYLRPGLRGSTLGTAMFLTPFVSCGLAMWVGLFRRWRGLPRFSPSDPRQVSVTASGSVVCRPLAVRRAAAFLICLVAVTFVVVWIWFFVGAGLGAGYWLFDGSVLDPPVLVPASIWVAILVGCTFATRAAEAVPVLTIDGSARVLQVTVGRRPAIVLPLADIDAVTVREDIQRRRARKFPTYLVDVVPCGAGPAVTVAEYYDCRNAESLADWVRGYVGKVSPVGGGA